MQRQSKTTGALRTLSTFAAAPTTPAVLTVDDVAQRLQVSKAVVYELTRYRNSPDTPRLPARKIGRSLRFLASEVDAWLSSLPLHVHFQKRQYLRKDATA